MKISKFILVALTFLIFHSCNFGVGERDKDETKNLSKVNKYGFFTGILGQKCEEVYLMNESHVPAKKIYVSTELAYPTGPENYVGFDGVVLRVVDLIDNEEVIYEAISIDMKDVNNVLKSEPNLENMRQFDES